MARTPTDDAKERTGMIVFEHTVSFWLLLAVTLLVVVVGVYSTWRYLRYSAGTITLTLLYSVLLVCLFWCLLLPGYRDVRTLLIKPRFIIALDTSQSMLLRADDNVATRWDRALRVLEMPWTQAVSAEAEIDVFAFADGTGERMALSDVSMLNADGPSTRLRDSLREIAGRYIGLNVAGLLLLSDGHDTREAFDDWTSDPLPFPVYTVRLEAETPWKLEPELRVDGVTTPRRVISGRSSEMRVALSGQGTQNRPITVQLFQDGTLLGEQPTQIPDQGGRREVTFSLQHTDIGIFNYRIFVPPLPEEKQVRDNEYSLAITVQDPRNRLLYVEGVPRFEYRFLRRALLADDQITPAIFYSTGDGTLHGGSALDGISADMTEQDLLQVKVVILGNLNASSLTGRRAENLVHYVESGGSLVLLGGTGGWGENGFLQTPLSKVLPVRSHGTRVLEAETPFETALTPLARAHPAFAGDDTFWSVLPPILTVFPDAEPKPGAEVLVTAATPRGVHPVLITQRYGQGRVAAIFTDSLWRWQLSPETEQQPYARLWAQLISWMLPEADDDDSHRLDFFTDQDQIHIGESIEMSARLRDNDDAAAPNVNITLPDGRTVPYSMSPRQVVTPTGRSFPGFHLRYQPEVAGAYSAQAVHGEGAGQVASATVTFQVLDYSPETAPRPVREDILRKLSGPGGLRYYDDTEDLNRVLHAKRFSVLEERRSEFLSLWQRWPIVVLLMALAAGMWLLRKSLNMP